MTIYTKDNYDDLCFELSKKKEAFEKSSLNIFTLQPELCQLIKDIGFLEIRKKAIEEEMKNE